MSDRFKRFSGKELGTQQKGDVMRELPAINRVRPPAKLGVLKNFDITKQVKHCICFTDAIWRFLLKWGYLYVLHPFWCGFFHYWGSPILGLDKKATNAMLLKVRFGAVGLVLNADVVKKGKPGGKVGII